MILYHGTNMDFDEIDLSRSFPYKDFGRGFYVTHLYDQAEKMARQKVAAFGGKPVVQAYEFDEALLTSGGLRVKAFESTSPEWAEFIFRNRSRGEHFHHDYDIVVGPVADDGVALQITRYQEGYITSRELARLLRYRKLNNQYYFGTLKAIRHLKRIS